MTKPLFDDTPKYDPHAVSIITQMLTRLRNNSPKQTSNVYMKNVSFIKEIYDGKWLLHKFSLSNENQYDLIGIDEKLKSCKGSWQMTRKVIMESLDNFELAKRKDFMPFNKKYIENISFSTYFEGNNRFSSDGSLDSYFMKFVNKPKPSYAYLADLSINQIKSKLPENIKNSSESFCKRWLKIKNMQLSFWKDIEDFARWLSLFKKHYPKVYSEFILACKDGNPFSDLSTFIITTLQEKEGLKPVINAYYFRLSGESKQLEGMFRNWLTNGIKSGKFNFLKSLPKSINEYYTDESFENVRIIKVEKKVVDAEELPIF